MTKKASDLLKITLMYVVACGVGALCCLPVEHLMLKMLVFDVVATIAIYACSVAWKNSSIYDAYWSVMPMILSIWLAAVSGPLTVWHWLLLICFNIWGLRLTLNWVRCTTGLDWEDWRYRKFRDEHGPAMWQFLNFTGIHMMPTLIVFAGFLPMFPIFQLPLSAWSLVGDAIILVGVALEHFADRQMAEFLKNTHEKTVCRNGLWRYSRHPNYLGEITVWWGVFAVLFSASPSPECYYYVGGAVAMVFLFNVVSIPMMEKRQKSRRADYVNYCRTTSRLLLLPPRRSAN